MKTLLRRWAGPAWLRAGGVLCVIVLIQYSCRKMDLSASVQHSEEVTTKFFDEHRSNNPKEKKLVDFVKSKYKNPETLEKIVKQIGYPRWEKLLTKQHTTENNITAQDSADLYYIPFVRDSDNYVNASLVIRATTNDTGFVYNCDWQYKEMQNNINNATDSAEKFVMYFLQMDHAVFGYTEFNITDSTIFRFNNHKAKTVKLEVAENPGLQDIQICSVAAISYIDCPFDQGQCTGPGGSCDGCSQWCLGWYSFSYCWTLTVQSGSGGGSHGSPGDGGGDGTVPPNPCSPFAGGQQASSNNRLTPCGDQPGWEPHVTPNGTDLNPSDSLTTAQSKTILTEAATAIQTESDAMFNVSSNSHFEWGMIIVKNALGNISVRNKKSDNDNSFVIINYSISPGQTLVGAEHDHVNNVPTPGQVPPPSPLDNSSPDPADLSFLSKKPIGYFEFVNCGNVRYAMIVENPAKAAIFFTLHPPSHRISQTEEVLAAANQVPTWNTNYQAATEYMFLKYVAGQPLDLNGNPASSASETGIGIYRSDNPPANTNFIKIN